MGGIGLNPSTLLSGQGIDVSSTVQQIIAKQSGPLTEWQNEVANLSSQAGLLLGINNNLTNLANAVNTLTDPSGALAALSANSSDPGIVTADAQTSAVAGIHEITVSNLANQSLAYSNAVTNDTLAAGTLNIQVGSNTPADVTITAQETLEQLASDINNQNLGVSATVIDDASGSRLSLLSSTPGQPGNLTVSATGGLNFTQVAGVNASLTVDGIPISSASNAVRGAIPGVTLNLASAVAGVPVQLTVGTDPTQAAAAVNNFVSAYNTLISTINQQYTVDPITNTEGPLGSDIALRSLQASLLNDAAYSITGNNGLVNLASLGINTNNDGTLSVGLTPSGQTLSQVLSANPAAFQNFFENLAGTGFANNFASDLTNQTDPTQGILNLDIAQNSATQKAVNDSITNFEAQMNAEQIQLTQQFNVVNANLQAYPVLLQEVTELIGSISVSSQTGLSSTPTLTSGL